jgi:DNA-binding HxlR family transcriptional regulator
MVPLKPAHPKPAKRRGNAFAASCPTRVVLDQIADKWTVLILGALRDGPVRFNGLRRNVEGISQKVLASTLRKLERNGLLIRSAYPTVPVTVEYSLTPLGRALSQLVGAVRCWAEDNIAAVLASQKVFDSRD